MSTQLQLDSLPAARETTPGLVAVAMSEAVIDGLEAVKVAEDDRAVASAGQFVAELDGELFAVEQTSERIVYGFVS